MRASSTAVPTSYRSARSIFSFVSSGLRWAMRHSILCEVETSSMTLPHTSPRRMSGKTMNGKTTSVPLGSTGRMFGTVGSSGGLTATLLHSCDGDRDLLSLCLGHANLEQPLVHPGGGPLAVDAGRQRDDPLERAVAHLEDVIRAGAVLRALAA